MTEILRKTCSSLVKIISDGENNFIRKISTISCKKISAKNKCFFAKYNCKSANMGSSTVQLHGKELRGIQIQNWL